MNFVIVVFELMYLIYDALIKFETFPQFGNEVFYLLTNYY